MERQQLAKIAVIIAGLDATPGVDIPAYASDYKLNVWGFDQGWIQAAYTADLMKGKGAAGFDARGTVTWAELLTVVLRAAGFGDELDNDNWKASAIAVALDKGLISTAPNADDLATYGDLVNQVYEAVNLEVVEPEPEVVIPKVLSVTPKNGVEVEVVFSEKVDAKSAETLGNYEIQTSPVKTPATAKLAADGVTVNLTFADTSSGATAKTEVTFLVKPVVTAADEDVKTERYVANYAYKDSAKPSISSIDSKTNAKDNAKTATVTFSEPVAKPLNVYINNVKIAAANIAFVDDSGDKAIELKGLSLKSSESHTIKIVDLTDKAGNKATVEEEFEITVDSTKPTVRGVFAQGDSTIVVLFSEEVDASAAFKSAKKIVKDELYADVAYHDGVVSTAKTVWTIDLNVATNIFKDKNSRTLTLVISGVKDLAGNEIEDTTKTVTLNKDTTAPELTGLEAIYDVDGKFAGLELEVNKAFADKNGYVIDDLVTVVDKNGAIVADFFGGFDDLVVVGAPRGDVVYNLYLNGVTPEGDNPVEGVTVEKAKSGKYTFIFKDEAFTDRSFAKITTALTSFEVTINETPSNVVAGTKTFSVKQADVTEYNAANGDNIITITFEGSVDGEGTAATSANVQVVPGAGYALDKDYYTLNDEALPSKATIAMGDTQDKVVITLPAGTIAESGEFVLAVTNVKNIDGVTVKTTAKANEKAVTLTDNTVPELKTAVLNADNTITIDFGETVVGPTIADFIVEITANDVAEETPVVKFKAAEQITKIEAGVGSDAGKYIVTLDALSIWDADSNGGEYVDYVLATHGNLLSIEDVTKVVIKVIDADTATKDAADNLLKVKTSKTVK